MDNKQGQILLRFPIEDKNKLDLIADERGTSKLIREIIHSWLNEHYPNQTAIINKMAYHREELEKLNIYLGNMSQIEATQNMDAKTRKQFLDDHEDAVCSMLWIAYIKKSTDNQYYTKWNDTLQFNSNDELKIFLEQKWDEYGRDEIIKLQHKSLFKKERMTQLKLMSESYHITLKEYIEQNNIDLDIEYDAGVKPHTITELDKFKTQQEID